MKEFGKIALIATGAFGALVAANIAAEALYTNSKVGIDKKILIISLGIGITVTTSILYLTRK